MAAAGTPVSTGTPEPQRSSPAAEWRDDASGGFSDAASAHSTADGGQGDLHAGGAAAAEHDAQLQEERDRRRAEAERTEAQALEDLARLQAEHGAIKAEQERAEAERAAAHQQRRASIQEVAAQLKQEIAGARQAVAWETSLAPRSLEHSFDSDREMRAAAEEAERRYKPSPGHGPADGGSASALSRASLGRQDSAAGYRHAETVAMADQLRAIMATASLASNAGVTAARKEFIDAGPFPTGLRPGMARPEFLA